MADTPTQFFKFIRPPFNLELSIPRAFLPYLNCGRCSKATLRREGHEWPVKITDGNFSGDGWRKCVTENGVEEFDIIVFEHQGNMVFDFLVFDPSGCEKEYPNPSCEMDVEEPLNESKSEEEEEEDDDDDHPKPYFVSKLKSGNIKQSILYLPTKFAKKNGLVNNREIILKNGNDERSWIVELKNHKNKYCYIGRGWKDFRVANDLKKEDHFKLQIIENIGEKLVVSFSVLND